MKTLARKPDKLIYGTRQFDTWRTYRVDVLNGFSKIASTIIKGPSSDSLPALLSGRYGTNTRVKDIIEYTVLDRIHGDIRTRIAFAMACSTDCRTFASGHRHFSEIMPESENRQGENHWALKDQRKPTAIGDYPVPSRVSCVTLMK